MCWLALRFLELTGPSSDHCWFGTWSMSAFLPTARSRQHGGILRLYQGPGDLIRDLRTLDTCILGFVAAAKVVTIPMPHNTVAFLHPN